MTATQCVPEERTDQVLMESIRERRPGIVSHRLRDCWRTFRSCFVGGSRERSELLLELQASHEAEPGEWPRPGEDSVGVTFRAGHVKCMFSSVVMHLRREEQIAVLQLRWPSQLQKLQRRAYERAAPPPSTVIAVRFWTLGEQSGDPVSNTHVRYGQLEDISAGGIRIRTSQTEGLNIGATYRCAFSPRTGGAAIVTEAVLRHREASESGRACLGFQFLGLEATEEGRRQLDRIALMVGHFHRIQSRSEKST